MTDTEKKIAEIREALEKATPGPWNVEGKEIWKRAGWYFGDNPHVYICDADNPANAHLIANAPEWLRFLLSELDRAEKELELFDQRGETIERQLNIIEQLQEENRKLREERDAAVEGYQQQVKYSGELMTKLVSAQQELDMYKSSSEVFYERLKKVWEERDKLIKLLDMIKDDADRFGELVGIDVSETSLEEKGKTFNRKIETLQKERDKLIEVLREVVKFDYHTNPEIHYKRLARKILEEIGVAVEPDRLHDARVKIAKARFSPDRLISEREESGRCEF